MHSTTNELAWPGLRRGTRDDSGHMQPLLEQQGCPPISVCGWSMEEWLRMSKANTNGSNTCRTLKLHQHNPLPGLIHGSFSIPSCCLFFFFQVVKSPSYYSAQHECDVRSGGPASSH